MGGKIETEDKKVSKVEGERIEESGGPINIEVRITQLKQPKLANGCPAWIWIAGKKYQI